MGDMAIDSFGIGSQNNICKNYSQRKIDRHIDYFDTKIEQYGQQLDEADANNKEQLKITTREQRREKYKIIETQLIY
jgi:hypothetical protein